MNSENTFTRSQYLSGPTFEILDRMKSGSVLIKPQFVTSTDNRELRAAPVITDNGLDNDKKPSY